MTAPDRPTPPPERPLPDDARARIRAELLGHAHDHRSASPRWLVPAGAAAAVALVAGLAYWAISPGGVRLGRPAGHRRRHLERSVVDRAAELGAVDSGGPGGRPRPPASRRSRSRSAPARCQAELENVLKGADGLRFPPGADAGSSSFWVKGDQFVALRRPSTAPRRCTHPLPL